MSDAPVPALYVYEGFNYAGNLIPAGGGVGQGSGLGWNGPWSSALAVGGFPVIPASLNPPAAGFPPTGGSIRQTLDPGSHYFASRFVQPLTIDPGQSLWFSAILLTSAEVGTSTSIIYTFNSPGSLEMRFETQGGVPLHWSFAGGSTSLGPVIAANTPTLLVAEVHRDLVSATFTFKYRVNQVRPSGADAPPAEPPAGTQTTLGGYSPSIV